MKFVHLLYLAVIVGMAPSVYGETHVFSRPVAQQRVNHLLDSRWPNIVRKDGALFYLDINGQPQPIWRRITNSGAALYLYGSQKAFIQRVHDEVLAFYGAQEKTRFLDETITVPETNAKFRRVSQKELITLGIKDPEKFGEAWEDPSGMVWGDIAKDENGKFQYMNEKEAEAHCRELGARLPSGYVANGKMTWNGTRFPRKDSDFMRLTKYMGYKNWPHRQSRFYKPRVLPNLYYSKLTKINNHTYEKEYTLLFRERFINPTWNS